MINKWKKFLILVLVATIIGIMLYFVIEFNNSLHSMYSSIRGWHGIFDVVQTPINVQTAPSIKTEPSVHIVPKEAVQINNDGTVMVNCSAINKEDVLTNKTDTSNMATSEIFLKAKDAKTQYRLILIYTILSDMSRKIESGDNFASDLETLKMLSSSIPNLHPLFSKISVLKVKTKEDIRMRFIKLKHEIDWCTHTPNDSTHLPSKMTFWFKKLFRIVKSDEANSELNYNNITKEILDLKCKDSKVLELIQDVSNIVHLNLVMNEIRQTTNALLLDEYNGVPRSE